MGKTRAFIRYIKGKLVPGSLIFTGGEYPKAPFTAGKWQEVPYDICCGGGGNCCDPSETYQTSFTLPGTENDVVVQEILYIECAVRLDTGLTFTGWALPVETTTIQEFIDILNGYISPNIATFSWGGGTTINVAITSCLKDLICPNSELSISPPR
jgi:hypothetical protein